MAFADDGYKTFAEFKVADLRKQVSELRKKLSEEKKAREKVEAKLENILAGHRKGEFRA